MINSIVFLSAVKGAQFPTLLNDLLKVSSISNRNNNINQKFKNDNYLIDFALLSKQNQRTEPKQAAVNKNKKKILPRITPANETRVQWANASEWAKEKHGLTYVSNYDTYSYQPLARLTIRSNHTCAFIWLHTYYSNTMCNCAHTYIFRCFQSKQKEKKNIK